VFECCLFVSHTARYITTSSAWNDNDDNDRLQRVSAKNVVWMEKRKEKRDLKNGKKKM